MSTGTSQELALQAEVRRLRERIACLEQGCQCEERQVGQVDLRSLARVRVPIQGNAERHTGITIVGDVPWGTHFCQFYQDKQDLIDILVPYFKAGLENNEFCMWVTSDPLRSAEAKAALEESVKNLDRYIADGQLEILDYSEWYTASGKFESDRVLQGLIGRVESATRRGFDGMRLSGNTFWLEKPDWQAFTKYEATVNVVIGKYRMLAICTYSLSKCGAVEIVDVISNHAFALMKRAGKWERIDGTERKKVGASLQDSEERLRMAIASTGLGTWDFDPATGSVISSDLCKRHFGLPPERELDYDTFLRALHPDDRERVHNQVQEVLRPESGGHLHADYRTVGIEDGKLRWITDVGSAFFDREGRPLRLIGMTLDITERKRNEEELRRSREWFRVTLASIGDAVLTTDTTGIITFLNSVAAELTGWTVQEALGRPARDVFRTFNEQTREMAGDIIERVLRENAVGAPSNHTTLVTKSGGEIPIENTAAPISDRGNVTGVVLVFRDVTATGRAQAELVAAHEDTVIQKNRLKAVLEALPTGVSLIDAKGGHIESNSAFEQIWGGPRPTTRSVEDYAAYKAWWADTGKPVQPEEWAAARAVQKGETVVNQEMRIERFDGTRGFILNSAAPIRDAQARITGSAVGIRDITTLKKAEEALRDSEARFRALVTATSEVVYCMSADWKQMLHLRGRDFIPDTQEPSGTWLQKYIHPDDQQYVTAVIDEAIRNSSVFELEHRVLRVDGSLGWTFSRAIPIQNADGEVIEWFGAAGDITERKRVEEALRRSEARWNAAIENLGAGVVIATDTEQVIYRNPAARAIHGFTSDQGGVGPLEEMSRIFQLWTPDDRLLPIDEWPMRRIKRGETLNRLELRLRRLDQEWEKIISYSGAMVESAIGERLMFVSAQDLTDHRKAEQSLRESEERLRLLGDNLPDSTVCQCVDELDGTTRYTYFSAGIERLNGVTAGDVLHDAGTLHRQILPEHMDRFFETKSRSKRDLSDFEIEVPMRRSDGEVRWIQFHSRPRRLPDGRTIWDGVQTDVTARKQAENALKKQAELLKLSYDAMIVWKLDGAIESWNVGAERLYGYSELETVGKLTHTLLSPRFPTWDEILTEMRMVGSWEGEVRQQTRDSREIVVSARIQLIKGSDGIARVLEVDRDITEARRSQLEAFERQRLESLGTLASGIAHDFNNLLGAVLAQAELAGAGLAEGSLPHVELEAISEVAIRGSDIVRQLMIYAGKESDVLEFIDISRVVEEMYGLLTSAISKRAELVTDLSEHLPTVRARTAQLKQVLMNLVVNASDAIKDRNGVIRVTTQRVTLAPNNAGATTEDLAEGDYVQLEVSDTGSGMSHDIQARIFDPFFSTKSAGRGLGLPVIHGIVRSLDGAIRVESEVGKGTTFQILLPSDGTAARQTGDTVAGTEQELHRSSHATVLVVEDEAPLRLAVKKMLGKAGFTVLEAADGSEAVKLLHSKDAKIDLLFLDMTIPGCSSHEVLSEAVEAWPQLRVILTSAYSEEMVKASLTSDQVRGFVRKPFQAGTLLSALRNALSP